LLALLNPTSLVSSSGYAAIFVLCVLQSCCVPTSSELTMGFAGVLAAEGKLSLPGAILVGALGEVVGAYIAWVIGRTGGRAFVDRFGRYLLLSHRDLDRAERWYKRHGRWGVFGSRLLPIIRNFAALPAGVAEVPLVRFGVLTALGSLIWDGAMALIGYEVGSSWKSVMHGFSDAGYLLGALAVLAIAVFIAHRYRSYKADTAPGPDQPGQAGQVGQVRPESPRRY
jgi:membrane protein DedA with SNARE-associated domain